MTGLDAFGRNAEPKPPDRDTMNGALPRSVGEALIELRAGSICHTDKSGFEGQTRRLLGGPGAGCRGRGRPPG